jgi:hypothetical protein
VAFDPVSTTAATRKGGSSSRSHLISLAQSPVAEEISSKNHTRSPPRGTTGRAVFCRTVRDSLAAMLSAATRTIAVGGTPPMIRSSICCLTATFLPIYGGAPGARIRTRASGRRARSSDRRCLPCSVWRTQECAPFRGLTPAREWTILPFAGRGRGSRAQHLVVAKLSREPVFGFTAADSGDFVHAVRSFRTPSSEAAKRPTLRRDQPLVFTSFA